MTCGAQHIRVGGPTPCAHSADDTVVPECRREPADVDEHTGYRRYTTAQIPITQAIKQFRDFDMPLDQIRAVLEAQT